MSMSAEIALSFVPRVVLRRAFPPIVCGICVLCIGVALSGVGTKYWGGGAFCADNRFVRSFAQPLAMVKQDH